MKIDRKKLTRMRLTWLLALTLITLAAVFFFGGWKQMPLVLYKLSLVLTMGTLGLWFDRYVFPYARPDGVLREDWEKAGDRGSFGFPDYPVCEGYELIYAAMQLRRALIIAAFILGGCLGL